MDDLIIWSNTIEEHLKLLKKILYRIEDRNLRLSVEKTFLFGKSVKYLGHIINENGIQSDQKKLECIRKFPRPTNVEETQRFLGMCNYYRRYVNNYATIAKPMYILCKKDVPFVWNIGCEEAFEELKRHLCYAPVLAFPDFRQTFYITTDASDFAVGAVLSQGEYPRDHPIQYFSKTLNEAQCNYTQFTKNYWQ